MQLARQRTPPLSLALRGRGGHSCCQSRRPTPEPRRRLPVARALPGALVDPVLAAAAVLAFAPGMCFTSECQAGADREFLLALILPTLAAAAAAALVLRQPPSELPGGGGGVFEDEATGSLFQAADDGAEPERDKDGQLAFRAISYTPWPVPTTYEGERLRIEVGPVGSRAPRTFVWNRTLPAGPGGPSEVLAVTLPRPMGVVFEYDRAARRAVVAGVVEGGAAEQQRRRAALNPALARDCVRDGDVLRGVTCTNFVYESRALIGAVPPQRHVVVYGADKQAWGSIRGALRKGEVKDGPVTLVLERRRLQES